MNKNKSLLFVLVLIITSFPVVAHARFLRVKNSEIEAYAEPDSSSKVVDILHKNERYEILEQKNNYYKLKLYRNNRGWVFTNDVEVKGSKIALPTTETTILDLDKIYTNSYAVIIAIDNYKELGTLGYAKSDAAYIKRELRALGFDNFIELYDKAATRANITDIFERALLKKLKKNDRLFVFFAGKSLSNEIAPKIYEGYILPYDTKKKDIEETSFSIDVLDVFFAKLPIRHLLVVYDMNLSGLSLRKGISIPQSAPGYLLNVTSLKARQVISAGRHNNEMQFKDGKSIFITTLVEGMNGSAEQGVPDGIVTGSELGAYLNLKVSIKTRRKQTPYFGRVQGGDKGGEFMFTRRRGSILVDMELSDVRKDDFDPELDFIRTLDGDTSNGDNAEFGDLDNPEAAFDNIDESMIQSPPTLFPGELVVIPAGDFQMGSMDGHINEKPEHTIYLDPYYIGRYEVTNKEYKEFIDATGYKPPLNVEGTDSEYNIWSGSEYPSGLENHPVVNVSWYDAEAYCIWLSKVTGEHYRLPTEAEWEKAARGNDLRVYPWGNKKPNRKKANYNNKWIGADTLFTVGYFDDGKSSYWVHDMSGNVAEWCSDWYNEDSYANSPRSNPNGPEKGVNKVVRGG